jgi:hypothetical protein
VGAVGTTLAAAVAAIALAITNWDRRRAIPVSVNGWPEIEDGTIRKVTLANAADTPVFDVIARVIYKDKTLAVLSPNTLPPGTQGFDLSDPVGLWSGAADLNTTQQGPKVALLFRDASGRTWRKAASGGIDRQRFRTYNWAKEYTNALNEKPPLVDVDGDPFLPDPRRAPAKRWL